jgi:hypothetical protein
MTTLYASWPVDAAADQIRRRRLADRLAIRSGRIAVRRVSNTGGSRKNEVSFVVIASTTAVTSGSDGPLTRSRPTRPDSPVTPSDRASGSRRDSTRYCLESSRTIAARSATSFRM